MGLFEKQEERRSLKESLLFFFFPPKCAACGTIGYEPLCEECGRALRESFDPQRFLCHGGNGFADEMMRLFPYDQPLVRRMLLDWKNNDYADLEKIFTFFASQAKSKGDFFKSVDTVTFLPRRKETRHKVGHDQAELFARAFCRACEYPFEELLLRTGRSVSQHSLKGEDREKNVRGIFQAARRLRGENVLLVDDIVTTGAGARECARVLKEAGAMKVFVLCIAHS